MEKIRVFIGTEESQALPTAVCQWSILSRSKAEYEFNELKEIPLKLDQAMYTGFSFYRFAIPEKSGYAGKSIYVDADMIILSDLSDLYHLDMGGKAVLSRPVPAIKAWDTSVMLLDCAKLKHWDIQRWAKLVNMGVIPYKQTIVGGEGAPNHRDFGDLDPNWNSWDEYHEGTKLIHYTRVGTQPWKFREHPYAQVFLKELKSAINNGHIHADFVQKEIDAGHIYPEILMDVQKLET
jgi:hypothetical protein